MGLYGSPIHVQSIVQIQRSLLGILQNPESNLAKFPSDFELFSLGEFEETTGIITSTQPKFVMNLIELKEEAEK